jgi:hypothetical protein
MLSSKQDHPSNKNNIDVNKIAVMTTSHFKYGGKGMHLKKGRFQTRFKLMDSGSLLRSKLYFFEVKIILCI